MPTETAHRNVLHRRLDTVSRRRPAARHAVIPASCMDAVASTMSAPAIRMNRLNADLILLAAAAIWGLAFLFQKSAMAHVGPLTFIAARSALAAVALAPLAWREHARAGTADAARAAADRSAEAACCSSSRRGCSRRASEPRPSPTPDSSPRSTSSSRRSSPGAGAASAPNAVGVAGGRLVGVRHLAARRRRARRLLAGRHAGGAVGGVLGGARRHHRPRLAATAARSDSRRCSSPS